MLIVCVSLSTIIVVIYICSVYIARWAIRNDFGKMIAAVYSDPDQNIKNEYLSFSKEEILEEIILLHCKMHNAIKDEKFSYVQTINTRIFIATCRFTDIITYENISRI